LRWKIMFERIRDKVEALVRGTSGAAKICLFDAVREIV
jgi:hypothetical protein